ncbi:3-phosphoshikimate 1-carboxyvinyltransferase [Thiorhodovibrio frisius]|uniref:3-phosphoshikimate 1-carboxyvinyltransferase n=1 Tax=Thiorhodovibrio frisius TaxID=631362 RepID=H8Z7Y3_9GAMM|nr:3-phosphoshikimate 1-carboxyvinyltransferase [Thiorhodovibrio frisius]EIC20995.1 3-phosphoshikimate 1-carboxyvinyltransferase [Thiorhodovibrio frisius]WPL22051.1 3-phosphoshikimate 1-carboxyvinyltransferase [Thiorhodovibrio frisius]
MTAQHELRFDLAPGGKLGGCFAVPGDKSISHRAVMLGAIADGESRISGFLEGADSLATLKALRQLGVEIEGPDQGCLQVQGVGLHGLRPSRTPLDMGNSGTSMRLLTGLLSGQYFASELIGDASLTRRPMRRVTDPLIQMGARIATSPEGTAPLHIQPAVGLTGIRYAMPVASAQVKSSLLLAGLYASGETSVIEPAPTRDHTERMLGALGCAVDQDGACIRVRGGQRLTGTAIAVPGDISSAAFFLVGASIAANSELTLTGVGVNPTRTGVIDILKAMGADITLVDARDQGGEPVADLRVRSAELKGIRIPSDLVPLAIDEFPAIFVAAACAQGETLLRGAEELRVKESDRIQTMADGLRVLGIEAEALPDGLRIQGGALQGGSVDSHGDHRVAMAFAMAALRASAPIEVRDCANVNTSFPGFASLAASAGLGIVERYG